MTWDTATARRALDILPDEDTGNFPRALRLFLRNPTHVHRGLVDNAFLGLPQVRRVEIQLDLAERAEAEREDDTDDTPRLSAMMREAETKTQKEK